LLYEKSYKMLQPCFLSEDAIRKIVLMNLQSCGAALYVGKIGHAGPVMADGACSRKDPSEEMDPIMDNGACM